MDNLSEGIKLLEKISSQSGQDRSNIINLFKAGEPSFKEKLASAFLTLSLSEALVIYKLFDFLPEVQASWIMALEKRVIRQDLEVEYLNLQVATLDKELNEILVDHTKLNERYEEVRVGLKKIAKIRKNLYNSDEMSTDVENELLEYSSEAVDIAEKLLNLKPTK